MITVLQPFTRQKGFPSPARQAANAARAGVRVVAAAVQGKPVLVDDARHQERLAICRACPHRDPNTERCLLCGCFKSKTRFATEKCPDNPPRWT